MSPAIPATIAIALIAWTVVPAAAGAAQPARPGTRIVVDGPDIGAVPRHKSKPARTADSFDEPWVVIRTDVAGNSYYSYRVGSGSPFGPGRGFRTR